MVQYLKYFCNWLYIVATWQAVKLTFSAPWLAVIILFQVVKVKVFQGIGINKLLIL